MNIDTKSISTCMGKISTYYGHPLSYLSDFEKNELDTIGYSGKKINGEKISKIEYLNSLGKGDFKIEQTKFDKGDFCEEFLIIRVTE